MSKALGEFKALRGRMAMKRLLAHLRTHVWRGFWAIIPIGLSIFAIRLLYVSIDRRAAAVVQEYFGYSPPGLGILLAVLCLYVVGVVASNVVGRQTLGLLERLSRRIPVVRTTYRIGRELASTFTLPERQVFKRPVLIEFLRPGIWTVGFVTGRLTDPKNPETPLLKVYVPTPPNPTSGTIVLVPEALTRDPGWTIEETMQTVISAGIIGPRELR